jgi:L,D-transpeptidase YcbB
VQGQNQVPMVTSKSDAALRMAETKYSAIAAQGGFPKVPKGSYKKGSTGPAVAALNKRLYVEGYLRAEATQGQFESIFTTATQDAVGRYQRNLGLAVTGKVDDQTLFELNTSIADRLATIRANIPRLDIYDKDLGTRYLIVNIPAQQLETVSDGHVYSRHNVIVGRPERPSPVVLAPLETVKFNPYWNAPISIVQTDILPKMASGTQVLTDMNMKVFRGGPDGEEIDPSKVNWKTAHLEDYLFRQEPGPEGAMKTAKIEFNSTFGIYLHDTPEPQLFKTTNRFYSSGCIRIENMPLLVQWILNGQDGFGEAKIASMAETLERLDVSIAEQPQLRVAYLTAWPTANGTVAFRRDVYDMDSTGFTVGQPMPVGIESPDGLRYVLKPLPRQQSIDAAEAEGFHLFSFGRNKLSSLDKANKNVFGKTLIGSTKVVPAQTTTTPKAQKTGVKKLGLFDWISYRKEQNLAAKKPLIKDKKKKAVDSKLVKPKASKDLKPKAPKIDLTMADPCAADAKGKIPQDCLPAKPAKKK